MSKLILWLIRVYQKVISPWTPKTCRFHPTCSEYSYQAVKKYGALKGGFKSIKRIQGVFLLGIYLSYLVLLYNIYI